MTQFRCIPIEADTAQRFRTTGLDDSGNTLRRITADASGGFPCRQCLASARPGETMLLGSYNLPKPRGIYWTPSPIFLHAESCAPFAEPDQLAPIVLANGLVSVRAYDAADQCLYDLGHVDVGANIAAALDIALTDHRTAFVNIHTARPGCLLTRVELGAA